MAGDQVPDPDAILAEFEAALRSQPGIGQEGLDFLMPHLREAVESASLQPPRIDLDGAAWMDTFEAIVGDALDEQERNTLVRQLNDAIEPFGDERTQLALEFAKRLHADGEANALAWLAERKKAVEAAEATPPPSGKNSVPASAQAITRSRSRRLRGPPS